MKITYTPSDPNETECKCPFFARYNGEHIILITKKGKRESEGYLVSDNGFYRPFEYFSKYWSNHDTKPLSNGKIEIDLG